MAEMVVHSAYVLDLPLCHQVLSISNETQDELHLRQVTIQNGVEPIQKEMPAGILRMRRFSRRKGSLRRKRLRNTRRAMSRKAINDSTSPDDPSLS